MKRCAYYSSVTEYEQGWGSRHDGYLVALSLDDFKTKQNEIEKAGEYTCYSRIDNKPKLCEITEEMEILLNENSKVVWTGKNKTEWLVSE